MNYTSGLHSIQMEKWPRIVVGFTDGFHLWYQGPRVKMWAENPKSAEAKSTIVGEKPNKQLQGRIVGLFNHWSNLGLVYKKQERGFRLFYLPSWPEGDKVNNSIAVKNSAKDASVGDALI